LHRRRVLEALLLSPALALPAAAEIASRPEERGPIRAATRIVVLGDSLGEGLWASLYRRFYRAKGLQIINAAKASTGFNATPYEDEVDAILRRGRIDLLVVQTGANDRQRVLSLDGKSFARFGTPEWFTLYGQRLTHFLARVEQRRIPVLWVGLPVMRQRPYDEGMRIITRMHQEHAERHGAIFLDIARFTADEEGEFVELLTVSPGRQRRFRHEDGVHFWEFGYDRVAAYVVAMIRGRFPGLLPQ
jgi:hypothetical protein